MATVSYRYKARDPLGAIHEGAVSGIDDNDATQQLRQEGFQVISLEEDDEGGPLFPRRITKQNLVYTTNQLAIMLDTGIPLSSALNGVYEQEENPTLKAVLGDLKQAVEGGEDFSAALARHGKWFDKTYVSLVRASEATGGMGAMLDRIAGYLRKEMETRAKVRASMAYPMVMLAVALAVTTFLLTYVLPKFTPLFSRKGMKLPKPTVIMMSLSDALVSYWYLWLLGIVAAVIAFVYGRRTEVGRGIWDSVKINLPLTGPMTRKVIISRSIRTLGTMLSSGVSMLESLQLTADVAGNVHYEKLWLRVLHEVTGGSQLHEVLRRDPLFPKMLVQMIAAGEQSAQLGPVLERISDYYDREVETSLKTVTSLIEPIMITVMGGVVGGIGLALLLPIFSLSKSPAG